MTLDGLPRKTRVRRREQEQVEDSFATHAVLPHVDGGAAVLRVELRNLVRQRELNLTLDSVLGEGGCVRPVRRAVVIGRGEHLCSMAERLLKARRQLERVLGVGRKVDDPAG